MLEIELSIKFGDIITRRQRSVYMVDKRSNKILYRVWFAKSRLFQYESNRTNPEACSYIPIIVANMTETAARTTHSKT